MVNYIQTISSHQTDFSYPAFFKLLWLTLAPKNIYIIYRSSIYMAPIYIIWIKKLQVKCWPKLVSFLSYGWTCPELKNSYTWNVDRQNFLNLISFKFSYNFQLSSFVHHFLSFSLLFLHCHVCFLSFVFFRASLNYNLAS